MSNSMDDCRKVHELWDSGTSRQALDKSQRDLIEEHLKHCDNCRFEAVSIDSMDVNGPDGPPRFLEDDIARRKWIDSTVARAAEAGEHPTEPRKRTLLFARLAAAAVVGILIGATALFVNGFFEGEAQSDDISSPVADGRTEGDGSTQLTGRVLLRTREEISSSIKPVGAGDSLKAGDGRLVVDLGTGVRLYLVARTEAEITQMDSDNMEVNLVSGRIIASVDPMRSGPKFAVSTEEGTIFVKGTVFSVEATEDSVRVGVMRGEVSLEEKGGSVRTIGLGQSVVMGRSVVAGLLAQEEEEAQSVLKMLDMLTSSDQTRMYLKSLPAGAVVSVDKVTIGRTPLFAAIRAGHRALELEMDGRAPVRELVEMGRDTEISRVFALKEFVDGEDAATIESTRQSAVRAVRATPSEMLAGAQGQRASRNWKGAAKIYSELINAYPRSMEARTSLISLGVIQLDHLGQPGKALDSFGRYLSSSKSGALAQEAAWGKTRAFAKLSRKQAEMKALEEFLGDFPGAIQAPMATKRLRKLKEEL